MFRGENIHISQKLQWFPLVFFLSIITLVAYYPNLADDYDLWWHLAYGRHFVGNLTWRIDHSIFSWTPAYGQWPYVTWISSSVLYILYHVGGYFALNVLQWFVFGLGAWLFLRFVRLCKAPINMVHFAALFFAAVALNPVMVYIKPELFSLLFFSLCLWIYFESVMAGRKWFWAYPLIFIVWVNTHGGFVCGLAFITIALGAAWWAHLFKKESTIPIRPFAISVTLCYLAVFVNPYGIDYLIQIIGGLFQAKTHIQHVAAYAPLWQNWFPEKFAFRRILSAWIVLGMTVAWLVLTIRWWLCNRNINWAIPLSTGLFLLIGMFFTRAIVFFCVAWLFTMQYMAACLRLHFNGKKNSIIAGLLIVVPSGLLWHHTICVNVFDSWFGSGIERFIPVKETAFIAKAKLPTPIFNDYLTGGYLLWALPPGYKVFIDPRWGPYVPFGVWDDYVEFITSPSPQRADWLRRKYPFNTAIIHVSNNHTFVDLFLNMPDWALIYFDNVAAVFVRQPYARNLTIAAEELNMNPAKFEHVANPNILFNAFYLYCNYDLPSAPKVMEIYRRNVSFLFYARDYQLNRMSAILRKYATELAASE